MCDIDGNSSPIYRDGGLLAKHDKIRRVLMDKYYLWYDKNTKTIYPSTNRDFDLESPDIYKVDGEIIFFDTLRE